ncbi:MAG: hypothetical protein KF688_13100 [Pirellulales bacterium]|nr:hypothetical protein [Pirellulales bacterium]
MKELLGVGDALAGRVGGQPIGRLVPGVAILTGFASLQPAFPVAGLAGRDAGQRPVRAEVGKQQSLCVVPVRERVRLHVGSPGKVFGQVLAESLDRPRLARRNQAHRRESLGQVRVQPDNPLGEVRIHRTAKAQRFQQLLDAVFDAFGGPLRNLAQSDRRSLAVGGDEQNPPRAVLVAGDAGHWLFTFRLESLDGIAGGAFLTLRTPPTGPGIRTIDVATVGTIIVAAARAFELIGGLVRVRRARPNSTNDSLPLLIDVANFRTHFLTLSFWNFTFND